MARLHFVATAVPEAQSALANLRQQYDDAGPDKADIVVALGGDGFMLQTLHGFLGRGKPIYGMNLGTVGNGMGGTFTLAGDVMIGSGGATFDDASVGRGITLGLGVRVLKGDATGYAYCEQLDPDA